MQSRGERGCKGPVGAERRRVRGRKAKQQEGGGQSPGGTERRWGWCRPPGATGKGPGASLSSGRLEGFGSVTVASGLHASQSPQGAVCRMDPKVSEHSRGRVGGYWGLR